MRRIVRAMWVILAAVVVVCGLGVGGYYYFTHRSKGPKAPTAAELAALRVDLPENTTNLEDGLIQFTVSLQAADKTSKQDIADMLPAVEDAVNQSMRQFTKADLQNTKGLNQLKDDIMTSVEKRLAGGKITNVYFSTIVIQ
jgi:flagellar protein FliL